MLHKRNSQNPRRHQLNRWRSRRRPSNNTRKSRPRLQRKARENCPPIAVGSMVERNVTSREPVERKNQRKEQKDKTKEGVMNTVDATELGFASDRLSHLTAVIKADIAHEQYDGAVVMIARSGTVVLQEALGFAEHATRRTMRQDDVF